MRTVKQRQTFRDKREEEEGGRKGGREEGRERNDMEQYFLKHLTIP